MTENIIRKVVLFVLICSIGIQIMPVSAQTLEASKYQWQNVVIGCGGYVTGIYFSEAQKKEKYSNEKKEMFDYGGTHSFDFRYWL